jgi:hypothetical protein
MRLLVAKDVEEQEDQILIDSGALAHGENPEYHDQREEDT